MWLAFDKDIINYVKKNPKRASFNERHLHDNISVEIDEDEEAKSFEDRSAQGGNVFNQFGFLHDLPPLERMNADRNGDNDLMLNDEGEAQWFEVEDNLE